MPWDEALDLVKILRGDPSSMIAAALEGWSHPISREALVLMDLYDLDVQVATGGKPAKPHPGRPWKQQRETEQIGNPVGFTRETMLAHLRKLGHNLPPV